MARPEKVSDLSSFETNPANLVTFHADTLVKKGDARFAELLFGMIAHAQSLGWEVERGYTTTISIPFTSVELNKKLEAAQKNWDEREKWYNDAQSGADSWKKDGNDRWKQVYVDRFAADEELEPVDWDAIDGSEPVTEEEQDNG